METVIQLGEILAAAFTASVITRLLAIKSRVKQEGAQAKKAEAEAKNEQIDTIRQLVDDIYKPTIEDLKRQVVELLEALSRELDRAKQAELATEITNHAEYLDAVKEFNERAAEMGREVVETETIDMGAFMEEYEKQGYDPGVVEGLFPLFAE